MPIDGIKGPATSHASTSNTATDEQIAQLTQLIEEICANSRLRMSSMNARVDTAGGDEIDGVYEHAAPVTVADFGKTIEHVNEIITDKIKQRLDAGRPEPSFILAFDFDDTIKEQEWGKGQMIQSVVGYKGRDTAHLADAFASLSQRAICTCVISSRGSDAADHHQLWKFLDEKGFLKSLSKDLFFEPEKSSLLYETKPDFIDGYHDMPDAYMNAAFGGGVILERTGGFKGQVISDLVAAHCQRKNLDAENIIVIFIDDRQKQHEEVASAVAATPQKYECVLVKVTPPAGTRY
ncbi:hypothetical protein SC171_21200 [Pantoea cypripedii]|uniref:hypothetical protein n=1 Tax=Pantoea cypripedii TaxID=55209 RepID=UPI002FC7C2B9